MIHGARSLVCGLPLCLSSAVLPVRYWLGYCRRASATKLKRRPNSAYIVYHVS